MASDFVTNTCSYGDSLRSKRFRASSSRTLGREQKKRGMTGEGEGNEGNACPQPHDFEKLRSPTNAAFDWCGAGSVDYLALKTSIKPDMFCLRASQIWSDLICGRRLQMLSSDIYLNHGSCLCEGLSDLSLFDQKYNWRSSSGD